jgi:DNA polymerase III delta prime subunit
MDAQSALRRCIELFSHNTRFFIIVEDKYKLLKPILSRFCEIYVSEPEENGKIINLYKHNLNEIFNMKEIKNTRQEWLKKEFIKYINKFENIENIEDNIENIVKLSIKLYEKGYNGIDIINLIETTKNFDSFLNIEKKYELLFTFNKVKKELRNEKILILFILNFVFLDNYILLENISFM